ncbi:MAG TPA: hypothetical protein DCP90_03350 [Clostridiales bacterium]|nr:MAG: hypothetical protein A2Y22_03045 [Clostridiales bacterium GWD2_32_59]HAN09632.1 hypothetical protein [Clostridiales bacterium]
MNIYNYTKKLTNGDIQYFIELLPEKYRSLKCNILVYDSENQALEDVKDNPHLSHFDEEAKEKFKLSAIKNGRKGYVLVGKDFSNINVIIFAYKASGHFNFAYVLYHELHHVYQIEYEREKYLNDIINYKSIEDEARKAYMNQPIEIEAENYSRKYCEENKGTILKKYGDISWNLLC